MFRYLRKGRTSVYIQHRTNGSTIGAEKYEADIEDGKAILRFCLHPVDSNQKEDEEYFHANPLISVSIDDSTVVNGFLKKVNSHKQEITIWEVQIISLGKIFFFTVKPKFEQTNETIIIHFHVP